MKTSAVSFLVLLTACLVGGCRSGETELILYTSQDQVFAEPLLAEFQKTAGLRVRPIFDSEAVKTVGLANRLLAERKNPRADVFWNNEEFRTRLLVHKGALEQMQTFGYRQRVIVYHTAKVSSADIPRSLEQLTDPRWKGRVAMAIPLFGSTSTHFLALRQKWGEQKWRDWCQRLIANQPLLVDGNSVVVRLVERGEAWVGLTDSDDVRAAQRNGQTVSSIELAGDDRFFIRNSVGLVVGRPVNTHAEKFVQFVQSDTALRQQVASGAIDGVQAPETFSSREWEEMVKDHEKVLTELDALFVKR